ncbi:MAG: hypothetical protein N2483_00240 [Burkholderiaceae bacterium]|nr:hypothetical protein [Burkholderiaceae bacterium]
MTIKPKLEELKKQADAEIQAAKNMDIVAPLRRLLADGNLEKLQQLGEYKLCDGLHALLAAECKGDTDAVRTAVRDVLKRRDNTMNMSQIEKINYGQTKDGKQLTRNTKYTYAPDHTGPARRRGVAGQWQVQRRAEGGHSPAGRFRVQAEGQCSAIRQPAGPA